MAQRSIAAVILDLDGVLTDTAEYHFQAWKRLAEDEGISFTREDNEALRGVSRRRSLELLLGDYAGRYSEAEIQEMMARKNDTYRQLLQTITEKDFLPGARRLMAEIRQRGLKMAIGSASKNTQTVLARLGIEEAFDVIADGYSVERGKPAPDLFLYAAAQMEVSPEQCVVVEDAASGIDAALAAGMIAVGIGPEDRVGHAHIRFDTTADIELPEVLEIDP
ncbi:MAG: beta-phosphoglucomutase [Anaerolineae bacterium]|nr:beta-phosphoglucomutase [Anaerolineae bacterium]